MASSYDNRLDLVRGMVLLSLMLASCSTAFEAPVRRDAPNCAWQVCVRSAETVTGRVYRAVNREPVAATVVLSFNSLENFGADVDLPAERVVPPGSTETLVRLQRIERYGRATADASIAIDLGSSDTKADTDYLYAVPFGGPLPRELTQGFNGAGSHLGGMSYALDFAMPEGTPVLASRPGVVLYVQDGFSEGELDPDMLERANVVVIAHGDGSMASYGHLAPGIPVSRGQHVREGDVLGRSGSTGFAGQPHLHFHVGLRLLRDPGRTIPIKLKGPEDSELAEEAALGVSIGRGQWSRLTTIGWSAAALMALVLGWSLLRS